MSKVELQLRDACNISPDMTISYSDPGLIKVSRNTMSFSALTTMSVPQLNVLMTIIRALQRQIEYGAAFTSQYTGEVEIPIQLRVISGCHSYEDVMPAIMALMNVKLIYSHEFDGMVAGVTSMISAAEYRAGRIYVVVPGRALPWYLFCGRNVGFARIEHDVFVQLSFAREKILYLKLMSYVDYKTQKSETRVSVQELRKWLNYSNNEPFGRIKSRVIEPLIKHLQKYGSRYTIQPEYQTIKSGQKGKPAIGSVVFFVNGQAKSQEDYEHALQLLTKCWNCWSSHRPNPMNSAIILQKLGDSIPSFNTKIYNARSRRAAKSEKRNQDVNANINIMWLANLVKKILQDDYHIDIYETKKY